MHFPPIAVVLVLMIGFKWGGGRAGAAGWFAALIVSVIFFGADATLLAYAQTKGVLLAIYVLYIVWMALVLYNVVQETGAIETIGAGIKKLTDNRALQVADSGLGIQFIFAGGGWVRGAHRSGWTAPYGDGFFLRSFR